MLENPPLTIQQLYQRYLYRSKCHKKLHFTFKEFAEWCRENTVRKSDWVMCTKPFADEITLDDFIIYRNGKMGDEGEK